MKTQQEQIKAASRAYLLPLNKQQSRFQVYLLIDGQLDCLWPWHDKHGKECQHTTEKRALLPNQIECNRDSLPHYHFHLTGYNFSKKGELRMMLEAINPEITVECLTGWRPQGT